VNTAPLFFLQHRVAITAAALLLSLIPVTKITHASHHNDSMTAKKDGRLNLTDMYVFPTRDNKSTVFIMNIGKDAGRDGPKNLHPEAVYDFNIDINGDYNEDMRFRFRFEAPGADGAQSYSVSQQSGAMLTKNQTTPLGAAKKLGDTASLQGGGRAWAGLAGDPFVANAVGYFKLIDSVKAGKADFSVFDKPTNYFAETDVISIVLEIPNTTFKKPDLNIWSTITAVPPGETFQVSRWGNVLTAFIFAPQPEDAESMNRSKPNQDKELHRARAALRIAAIVKAAGTAVDPQAYGEAVAEKLTPIVTRYRVGTPAVYGIGHVNGRALSDDSFDVIMSTVTNRTINDGITPGKMREDFPYLPISRRIEPWVSGR
jgi:hypothetical protein